jgi:ankyrin repeat protein
MSMTEGTRPLRIERGRRWATPLLAGCLGFTLAAQAGVGAASGADPDRRLVDAVEQQDKTAVKRLLTDRVDVNATQADGTTALHWAAYRDDRDTAEQLIRSGAKVNVANQLGVTALYLACMNRSAAMAERLLKAGANPNAALPSGESALMTAARTGGADVVKLLVSRGANVNAATAQQQTALMWAVAFGHPDVVRTLVEVGADIHARSAVRHRRVALRGSTDHKRDHTVEAALGGFTPLLFAATQGNIESARALLDAQASIADTTPEGASTLVVAAYSGHGALARFLLDRGADPNSDGAGYAPLHAAVLRGDLELVKALLARGANPNAELKTGTRFRYFSSDYAFNANMVGATPLWLAAKYGELDMMRLLAASGADPRRTVKDGGTLLMAALGGAGRTAAGAGGGASDRRERYLTPTELALQTPEEEERLSLAAAKLALQLGSDVNARTESGDTALYAATSRGYQRVAQLLVDHGADVNAATRDGETVLHNAAYRARLSIIRLLVSRGARLDVRNSRGETPLARTAPGPRPVVVGTFVTEEDLKKTADLLRELGATE